MLVTTASYRAHGFIRKPGSTDRLRARTSMMSGHHDSLGHFVRCALGHAPWTGPPTCASRIPNSLAASRIEATWRGACRLPDAVSRMKDLLVTWLS